MVTVQLKSVEASVAGPASYNQATGVVISVPNLKHILEVRHVRITGSYIAKVTAVGVDAKVTVKVYQVSTTTGLLVEVANATNLSAETITVNVAGI